MIRFGPGGLGPVKDAVSNLEEFSKLGLKVCEIEFTYGIYIKEKEALEIGKKAKELGIKLSIHAPYWLNLNSEEKKKIEESKKRILDCCRIGEKLGVDVVVFHPGYYSGMDREQAYNNIKEAVMDMQKEIKKNNWKLVIAPETMGKNNVFGSLEEIAKLVKETGCGFCLDFAHILARYKEDRFDIVEKNFGSSKHWHCHFSGIEYTEKGEKRHIKTSRERWKKLLENLPKNKEITIINESPDPVGDSVAGLKLNKD